VVKAFHSKLFLLMKGFNKDIVVVVVNELKSIARIIMHSYLGT
jgi:hypothetical protein